MKVLVIENPRDAKIVEIETPKATGDLALVKVARAGICATDLSIYTGESSFVRDGSIKYPVRIGHEWSGIIESVGEEVKNFKPGDRVVSDSGVACGKCEACKNGVYADCKEIKSLGTVNTWDGSFAEYILMPERHLFKVPDNVTLDEAALIEPMAIAYDAFRDVKIDKDTVVAVIGTGAIGMAAVWFAKSFGAEKVIMVGRRNNKLQKAIEIGATDVINSREVDPIETIKAMTDGKGANLIIETSGSDQALLQAVDMVANYGVISLISFYEKLLNDLPIDRLVLRCVTMKGAAGSFGAPGKVAEIISESDISLEPLISHRTKFEDCLEFFENTEKYQQERIKVMVEFD